MKVSYSAIVLDEISHNKLVLLLGKHFPEEAETWKVIAHHMTICMGELPTNQKQYIGETLHPMVSHIGKSDMAIAVRLQDNCGGSQLTTNKIPHVTLAINPNGGKAVMSNQITDWEPIYNNFLISGTVQELAR